jgi:hypothetical protein
VSATLVIALALAPAAAAQYPIESGTLTASQTVVVPGEEVEVTGGGFEPGTGVDIFFLSEPVLLKSVTADAEGGIETTVEIPESATEGSHTLEARGAAAGGGTLVLRAPVEVVVDGDDTGTVDDDLTPGGSDSVPVGGSGGSSGSGGGGGSLPFTGSDLLALAGIGLLVLGGGITLRIAGRRRALGRQA